MVKDEAYKKRVKALKPFLPRYYAAFIRQTHPQIKQENIWNVVKLRRKDEAILSLLEHKFGIQKEAA